MSGYISLVRDAVAAVLREDSRLQAFTFSGISGWREEESGEVSFDVFLRSEVLKDRLIVTVTVPQTSLDSLPATVSAYLLSAIHTAEGHPALPEAFGLPVEVYFDGETFPAPPLAVVDEPDNAFGFDDEGADEAVTEEAEAVSVEAQQSFDKAAAKTDAVASYADNAPDDNLYLDERDPEVRKYRQEQRQKEAVTQAARKKKKS